MQHDPFVSKSNENVISHYWRDFENLRKVMWSFKSPLLIPEDPTSFSFLFQPGGVES